METFFLFLCECGLPIQPLSQSDKVAKLKRTKPKFDPLSEISATSLWVLVEVSQTLTLKFDKIDTVQYVAA